MVSLLEKVRIVQIKYISLRSICIFPSDITFWKYPSLNESVDIMASPEKLSAVEQTLNDLGLEHMTVVEDVEELFENQNDVTSNFNEKQASSTMSWNRYHRYDGWSQCHNIN